MESVVAVREENISLEVMEQVLLGGDLSKLSREDRLILYRETCRSLGINPLTRPFDYLKYNGKEILYANRNCTDQLRATRGISLDIINREIVEGVYIVSTRASMPDGRHDEKMGALFIANLKGEGLANAMMKCETKSGRRATLSLCGLSMLDETEVESLPPERANIPGAYERAPRPPQEHPTKDQMDSLQKLARSCDVDEPEFWQQIRRMLDIFPDEKISKKGIRDRMSMSQYEAAEWEYRERLKKLIEEPITPDDVSDFPDPQAAQESGDEPITASEEVSLIVELPAAHSDELAPSDPTLAYATLEQIRDLRALALQVSARIEQEVVEDLKGHGGRLRLDVYRTMRNRILEQLASTNGPLIEEGS